MSRPLTSAIILPKPIVWLLALPLLMVTSPALAVQAGQDAFTRALAEGPLYAALAALAGGLLVSLTPCVYPMIAVTVSVFGANKAANRAQGALLSLSFMLGIVAMFVPLGVAAGLSGSLFGSVLQSPWVLLFVALLFVAMAMALFGAFEFTLPSGLVNRLAQAGGIGFRGAFMLGLVCGVIAAPCTGPVLTGILTFIAQTRSVPLGALAMLAFSLGLGAPFFVVGTFAVQLPKSGPWMVHVKSALGIVLLVVSFYFLNQAFPFMGVFSGARTWALVGLGALVLGVLLGAVHRDFADPSVSSKLLKGTGVALASLGAFLAINQWSQPDRTLNWQTISIELAKAQAKAQSRPLLVDFTAAWCAACKELDKHTFSHPEVARAAGRFVAVRVDATRDDDPKVEAALQSQNVRGLPTVILFDSNGQEAHRYVDFVPPAEFLAKIEAIP